MSSQLEPIKDPGLPAHVHRKTDTDPKAADRAERQVAVMFGISALGTVLLIISYVFIPDDVFVFIPIMGKRKVIFVHYHYRIKWCFCRSKTFKPCPFPR